MIQIINGQLEIDSDRGVIYFHSEEGRTILRICSLPKPIPDVELPERMLDITHLRGCDWR